jgi:predicted transcriptional regulator/GTPase SAR1 family protein
MSNIPNPQIEMAFEYVQNTNKNIFLTGKAGTGKTTFLHRIKRRSLKRLAIVAPTGVAAINAKGMTIHSLFQLPFGAFLPGVKNESNQRKFSGQKIKLIKSLDLLIIDEISMVRADLLDAIDEVLRKYKNPTKPFGGVQLLMIGDLHQLPPVVKPNEWSMLRQYYSTPYFFGSLALQKTDCITIQLKHIYRQSDSTFIDLLNKVRNNQMTPEVLDQINSRYIPDFRPKADDGYITLTSHNAAANKINQERLAALTTKVHEFKADVTGIFPPHTYPNEEKLQLKIGSQVVFIKNDLSPDKRYYNGKIGQIEEIKDKEILVKCPHETDLISVGMVEWQNLKFNLNEKSKEISEEAIGTFTHYPLKLAWAITIHKSQGLTFEKAIIDAKSAFAHGQVYVALSRCKSFEGIVLLSEIGKSSVRTDSVVKNYSAAAEKNEPDETHLEESKEAYQQQLIRELFIFNQFEQEARKVNQILMENERIFANSPIPPFRKFIQKMNDEVIVIANKFLTPLDNYFRQNALPKENEALLERVRKAAVYFSDKITNELSIMLQNIPLLTDNQSVKGRSEDGLQALERVLFIKNAAFEAAKNGFDVQRYIKVQANADIDFTNYKLKNAAKKKIGQVPKNTKHPKLYAQLLQWREQEAGANDVKDYEVLPVRSLDELVQTLPTNSKNLKKIKGIGDVKVRLYGEMLINIIQNYCVENGLKADAMQSLFDMKPPKSKKADTKQITFDLYKQGKTITEIATERSYTTATIQGHLAHFIALGKVEVTDLMKQKDVDNISDFFIKNNTTSSKEGKVHFGETYSYNELKMVLAFLQKGDV